MVEAFVKEGCLVSYCARTVKPDDFDLKAVHGTSVDIGNRDELYKWVEDAGQRFGRIDIVIANGKTNLSLSRKCDNRFLTKTTASNMHFDSTPETWQSSFSLDIMGFVNLVEASTPYLLKSPKASIIVQSSFMGREFFRSPPAPYGACKAAQLQHVQELSHYLGPKGIRVNAMSPGPIWAKDGAWESYSKVAPEWVEAQRKKVPLKRFGTPEDVANVAVFLASPLSGYVQGANILVDGGIHIGTSF